MTINGLDLPPELMELIDSNRWRIPPDADLKEWERVLQHGGLCLKDTWVVRFFSIPEMEEHTRALTKEAYPQKLEASLGSNSMANRAVPFDRKRSIVIADLMHAPEKPHDLIVPVVLDFRRFANGPRVIYYPDDAFELYWCEIAANIEEFAELLKL